MSACKSIATFSLCLAKFTLRLILGQINHVSGSWVGKILVGGHVLVTGVVVLTENFLTEFFLLLLLLFFRGYKIRNPFFFFCCEL